MNLHTLEQPHDTAGKGTAPDALQWREEWVNPGHIVRLTELQVRAGLDRGAVKRYAERAAAGHEPPPIKLARVPTAAGPVLYLLDGWHRMEANALQRIDSLDGAEVLALVADMSETEARWQAARSNLDHGVPLKAGEYRNVLRAFIKAGKYRKGRGEVMSYRELGAVIGKPHTTVRNWVQRDFPKLARSMGGTEGGNPEAMQPGGEHLPLSEAHRQEALTSLQAIRHGAQAMDPEGRHEVALALEALLAALRELGTAHNTTREEF